MTTFYDFFKIEYGQHEFSSKSNLKSGKVPLISSKGTNQGIYGLFEINPKYKKVISVPRTGTICEAFYQEGECCIDDNCLVMIPKKEIDIKEMIYFVLLVRMEKYKYVYGRQVTPDRLGNTKIPNTIPKWIIDLKISLPKITKEKVKGINISLKDRKWKFFRYDKIFDIRKGYYNKKPSESSNKEVPFIGATDKNNGVTSYHLMDNIKRYDKTGKEDFQENGRIFDENSITISNNGSVGYAFYQSKKFTCSHDVNPVYLLNKELNVFIAMFLCTVIGLEKYRWNYGRKWRPIRMPSSLIKLPVDSEGNPDWQFMEDYIKSLPYSKNLEN